MGRVGRALQPGVGKAGGYLNTNLYQTVATTKGTFRDITSGNNGHFKAAAGWDPCSGWGSPIGTAIQTALKPLYKKKK